MEKKYQIVHNRIRCLICEDVIESETVHDYRTCSCGACAADGGKCYLRRSGNRGTWEDCSEVVEATSDDSRRTP